MSGERRFYPLTESDLPMHGWRPYSDVHRERIRAHAKHDGNGDSMERKPYDDESWLSVLVEEIGEVAKEVCDFRHDKFDESEYMKRLREELIQVAAMAVAWIDAIDLTHCCATFDGDLANPHAKNDSFDRHCGKRHLHSGDHVSWSGRTRWTS